MRKPPPGEARNDQSMAGGTSAVVVDEFYTPTLPDSISETT